MTGSTIKTPMWVLNFSDAEVEVKMRIQVMALLIATGAIFAQVPSDSTEKAWYKAKWGMTRDQVKETFSSDGVVEVPRENSPRGYCVQQIKAFKIGTIPFTVKFILDTLDNRLRCVVLSATDMQSTYAYMSLKEQLVRKYGKPGFENENQPKPDAAPKSVQKLSSVWNLKGMTINLEYLDMPSISTRFFSVVYSTPEIESKL